MMPIDMDFARNAIVKLFVCGTSLKFNTDTKLSQVPKNIKTKV